LAEKPCNPRRLLALRDQVRRIARRRLIVRLGIRQRGARALGPIAAISIDEPVAAERKQIGAERRTVHRAPAPAAPELDELEPAVLGDLLRDAAPPGEPP